MIKDAEEVKRLVRIYHWSDKHLQDEEINSWLSLDEKTTEDQLDLEKLKTAYGQEQFTYEGTSYAMIREFYHFINPTVSDTIYDLGSGFGRVVIYGSIISPAKFKGIEIVPERVGICQDLANRLKLDNIEFIQANALDQNFQDGNIFFLFNPFKVETLVALTERLKSLTKQKTLTIGSWGQVYDYLDTQKWLIPQSINFRFEEFPRLKVYKSEI